MKPCAAFASAGRHRSNLAAVAKFGDCWIEMKGMPRGSGYVFEDAIVGGVIPRQYIPAIDKGIRRPQPEVFLLAAR